MIAAFVVASVFGSGAQDADQVSAPDQCELYRAVLTAQWPLEPPESRDVFYLDPLSRERTVYYNDDDGSQVVADAAFVVELLPQLDANTAKDLASYFRPGPSTRIACDFANFRVTWAASSFGHYDGDQESLQFPRISLSEPVFSNDGRYAIGGYAWSFFPGRWAMDDCLFERVGGAWRMVACVRY